MKMLYIAYLNSEKLIYVIALDCSITYDMFDKKVNILQMRTLGYLGIKGIIPNQKQTQWHTSTYDNAYFTTPCTSESFKEFLS